MKSLYLGLFIFVTTSTTSFADCPISEFKSILTSSSADEAASFRVFFKHADSGDNFSRKAQVFSRCLDKSMRRSSVTTLSQFKPQIESYFDMAGEFASASLSQGQESFDTYLVRLVKDSLENRSFNPIEIGRAHV